MAAVDVAMPPPPAVRINRHLLAATDAVVCLWIASLWVLLASFAAALIAGLACGWGWGCTGAAWTAVLVSLLFVVLVWPCTAVQLGELDYDYYYINQLEKGAAALGPISEAVRNAHLIAVAAFACLEAFGFLLWLFSAKDPPAERPACVIMVVPPLGLCVVCCLVSIPGLAVRLWRMRRYGSTSVVPI